MTATPTGIYLLVLYIVLVGTIPHRTIDPPLLANESVKYTRSLVIIPAIPIIHQRSRRRVQLQNSLQPLIVRLVMREQRMFHLGRDCELQRIRVPSMLEQSLGVHLRRVTRQGRPWKRQEVQEKRAG